MICPICGKESIDYAIYCEWCGTRLRSVSEIEKSKLVVSQSCKGNKKFRNMCFGASIFSLIAVFFNFRGEEYRNAFETFLGYNDTAYIVFKLCLLFAFFFFGGIGIYFVKRNKRNQQVLSADDTGITDNSTIISFGFIPWEDVNRVYVNEISLRGCFEQRFIELEIKNELKYIKKVSWWKRFFVRANKALGHEFVCITLNATEADLDDTAAKITAIFKNAKQHEQSTEFDIHRNPEVRNGT